MRLLVDTHVVVWAAADPRAYEPFRSALEDEANEVLVSAVVTWELAIKVAAGKLRLAVPAQSFVERILDALHATELPIRSAHAGEVEHLPPIHADPFDRMLVAQARVDGLTLATADPLVRRYPVRLFPVGAPAR